MIYKIYGNGLKVNSKCGGFEKVSFSKSNCWNLPKTIKKELI